MKKNFFSIFSLWRKYKILSYLNVTVILVLSLTLNLSAAGFGEDKTSSIANPQQVKISGTVTDGTTGEALPGVSVVVPGTTVGTMTDISGKYSLNVPNATARLQFSFIGYLTQGVTLSGQTTLNVALQSDVAQLSEVVVVGYGTQLKKDLTGSVASISSQRLLDRPAFNIGEAMQGKVAGIQIVQLGGGAPGIAPLIRVRGTNSINTNNDPLFVVDGVVGVANAMSILNPGDIESINVLKDASSTAIYGARGSNGVVMITTKRGLSGKTQVEYTGSVSLGVMNRHYYPLTSDQLMYVYEQAMANGDKYGTINRAKDFRAAYATGNSYSELTWLFKEVPKDSYFLDLVGKNGKYYAPRFDTNWEKESYRSPITNNHQLSVRGGNENAKFALSLGNTNEQGLMKDSYFQRYSGRLNGDIKVFKWLDLSSTLNVLKTERTNRDNNSITRWTPETWPILPVKYPDDPAIYGIYANRYSTFADWNVGEQQYNPTFQRSENFGFNYLDQITGNVNLNVKIAKDLTFKTNFAVDMNYSKANSYTGKFYGDAGSASISTSNTFYWQNENYFNYAKTIGDHNLTAMMGLSWSRSSYENNGTSNSIFFDNFYQWHNIGVGSAARPGVSSSDGSNTLNSYFLRLNYGFKGKYLATLTGRYDGSSKFGTNSKYGFFPSAGLAWRVSDEDFIKNIPVISNLKLRTSWGLTGNQEIGSYVTQTRVSSANVVFGNVSTAALYPSTVGNNDLKWETTTQADVGLELGLWKDRINFDADYYNKTTTDMLLDVQLPRSTTVGSIRRNYGSVENRGWEFTLNTINIQTADFTWKTNMVFSANKNKILKLGPTGADILTQTGAGQACSVLRVGQPIGSFFGLNRLGVYSTEEASLAARYGMLPGDLKFEDVNKDGKISLITDGNIIGRAFPKWVMGFNNSFQYKNFDVGIDIRIVEGVNKANINESAEDRQLIDNSKNTVVNAWRPDNQTSMIAQLRAGFSGDYYQSYPDNHTMEDASFIRGELVTLGYTFSQSLVKKLGIQRLRINVDAKNFFLICHVLGYDPEGSSSGQLDALVPNQDKYTYPTPTTYSFGVNVVF